MDWVSGVTVPKLNQGNLRQIPIPVPPIPEKWRIVGILDEAFAGIAAAKANAEKNLRNARELFESELQDIFTSPDDSHVERQLDEVCQDITVGHVGSMKKEYREDDKASSAIGRHDSRLSRCVFPAFLACWTYDWTYT